MRHAYEPGSDEWRNARLGRPTASRFGDILTQPREKAKKEAGLLSKTAESYMHELLAEYMLGGPLDAGSSQWMQRGSRMEREAVAWYALEHDCDVEPGSLFTLDDGPWSPGATPDGLIGDDRGLELKILAAKNHVAMMCNPNRLLKEHYAQVQGGLWVTGRERWTLMAWHPNDDRGRGPGLEPVVLDVERDEEFIANMAGAVRTFVMAVQGHLRKFGYLPPQEE